MVQGRSKLCQGSQLRYSLHKQLFRGLFATLRSGQYISLVCDYGSRPSFRFLFTDDSRSVWRALIKVLFG
jgi:hypothetical protein